MDKLDKIINDRIFNYRSTPFKILEKRITEAFILERKIVISKYSKTLKNQSEKQFIVFMISCLESYLQDMFKLMIDKEIITLNQIMQIRKIKELKFNLSDLNKIQANRIKFSEIVINELNFQNFNEILFLCSLIDFEKYSGIILKDIKERDFGFTKKESEESMIDFVKLNPKKSFENNKFAKAFFKFVVRNMYRGLKVDKKRMLGTIRFAIEIRHKIVHKAADIKIDGWFSIGLMLSIIQFASVIQEVYNIKIGKVSPSPSKK